MKLNIFILITAVVFAFAACKKEVMICGNMTFCEKVDYQYSELLNTDINHFMATITADTPEDKLNVLNDWLLNMRCVTEAEIICNSCIYTNPPQSELKITFDADGKEVIKTMNVLMSDTLKFVNFHK